MMHRYHELLLSLMCASHNIIHWELEFQLFAHLSLAGLDTIERGTLGSFALLMTRELKYVGVC